MIVVSCSTQWHNSTFGHFNHAWSKSKHNRHRVSFAFLFFHANPKNSKPQSCICSVSPVDGSGINPFYFAWLFSPPLETDTKSPLRPAEILHRNQTTLAACVCVCVEVGTCVPVRECASNAARPRCDAHRSQRARTLLTVLLWLPVLKQTFASLCKCICVRVCLPMRMAMCTWETAKGRGEGRVSRWWILLPAHCEHETLWALHDTTLAVGAVNGVHTLFSSAVEWWVGVWRAVTGSDWRLRGSALWPTLGGWAVGEGGFNGCTWLALRLG